MNIEFKRVTKKLPEYKQIKQLYFSAFPSEERLSLIHISEPTRPY